jgi:hypothetical protein
MIAAPASDWSDYIAYRRGTADAVFLLDAGVIEYLGELQKRAERLIRLRAELAAIRDDMAPIACRG